MGKCICSHSGAGGGRGAVRRPRAWGTLLAELLRSRQAPRLRLRATVLSAAPTSRAAPAVSKLPLHALLFALSLQEFFIIYLLSFFFFLCYLAESLEKTLILGKIEGRRRRGLQRMRWLDDISESMNMNLRKL